MTYDEAFYAEETRIARASAEIVVEWLRDHDVLEYEDSVIDVGCGTGAWADECQTYDNTCVGLDHGVPREMVVCNDYIDADISQGIGCPGWKLAICLEVAEHLPPESAEKLVEGLSGAESVLFSAATPGQPGVNHINCQPHDYWHGLFAQYGFSPEHIGPYFSEPVADFYRRNMFLYRKA